MFQTWGSVQVVGERPSGTAGSRGSARAGQRAGCPPRRPAEELRRPPRGRGSRVTSRASEDRPGAGGSRPIGRIGATWDAAGRRPRSPSASPSPPGRRSSSARSMIAKPSPSCSSVMQSGGFVWIELLAIIVYRPFSRRNLPIAFISSLVPLNGVSGVNGSRDRTRSRIPNRPRFRTAPDRRVPGVEVGVVAAHDRAEPARRSRAARPPRRPRCWRCAAAQLTACDE